MVVVVSRLKPFESKTYKYVDSISVRGNSLMINGQYPEEEAYSVSYDRHEVVINVNPREE